MYMIIFMCYSPGFSQVFVYGTRSELMEALHERNCQLIKNWDGKETLILTDIHGKQSALVSYYPEFVRNS